MGKYLKDFGNLFDAICLYLPSLYGGFNNKHLFKDLETYCQFIGFGRSGHSLIGALLNAHPNMVVSHELGALKYVYAGFSKIQIYYLILKNAQLSAQEGQELGGYVYNVPNQWQGRVEKLRVIGDRDGAGDTRRLKISPRYIQRLRRILDVKLKFIFVIRNPYDNITTKLKRRLKKKQGLEGHDCNVMDVINFYFSLCETIANFKKMLKDNEIFVLRHESFIENPKLRLKELCYFLGVDAPDDYLNDCASIVYKTPHKSRYDIQWSNELIEIVKNRMDKYPFLLGYSYEE